MDRRSGFFVDAMHRLSGEEQFHGNHNPKIIHMLKLALQFTAKVLLCFDASFHLWSTCVIGAATVVLQQTPLA